MMPENSDREKQNSPQLLEIRLEKAEKRVRLIYEGAQEFSLSLHLPRCAGMARVSRFCS
jgi:hypothetical protein